MIRSKAEEAYPSPSIAARKISKINACTLFPAAAAACLILVPSSFVGRIMILSRLLLYFVLALLCASLPMQFPPFLDSIPQRKRYVNVQFAQYVNLFLGSFAY